MSTHEQRPDAPGRGSRATRVFGFALLIAFAGVSAWGTVAFAQPKKQPSAAAPADKKPAGDGKGDAKGEKKGATDKVKNFDFNGIDLNGRMRTPQLLYFLERANEELERASLEKRSFIPNMARSIEDEPL